jgi:hypothetical protein
MVAESRILFRSGVANLLQFHPITGVPLLVLSAGVEEVIHASFDFLVKETGL